MTELIVDAPVQNPNPAGGPANEVVECNGEGARQRRACCWLFFHRELGPEIPEAWEVRRFQAAAQRMGIELKVLKPRLFDLVVDANAGWAAVYQGRKLTKPDFIIPRTGSETTYFTLAVMRHFERQGVAMVNGSEAVETVADKLHTLQVLSQAGLPIPKTILGKFPVDADVVARELGFPVVVKTLRGTRGNGVLLCQDRSQFDDIMNLLEGAGQGADVIFQQYIRPSHGRDVRLLVVDGVVVAAMERRATDGGFKSNISLGGAGSRFDPSPVLRDLAVGVARELRLDVAGVDILFDDGGYRICEANSSPGFRGLEQACAVNVPELVFETMLQRHKLPTRRGKSLLGRLVSLFSS